MKTCFSKPVSIFARMLTILAMLLALTPAPAHAATIVYVVPGGNGTMDGSSWANGKDLAAALAGAGSGTQLYIKTGIYKPTSSTDVNATFTLKNGVELRGGFAGVDGESIPTCSSPSTLSGNIGSESSATDNSKHVVVSSGVDSTAFLDCLIIENGYSDLFGGGIYNEGGSPTLTRVIIRSNYADASGGGMYNSGGSPTLAYVNFLNNTAVTGGGGMYNSGGSPTLTHVTFSGNHANRGMGGGMFNYGSSPTLTDVNFQNNTADSGGGGVYNSNSSTLTLNTATFTGNTSSNDYGGGIFSTSSSMSLTDVTFESNICNGNSEYYTDAPGKGGGLATNNGSTTLTRVTFRENIARGSGGGMYSASSSPVLTEVTFEDNSALSGAASLGPSTRTYGGGMYSENGSPTLRNVTFRNNQSTSQNYESYGGGMSIKNDSGGSKLTNVIFLGNAANNGAGLSNLNSSPTLTHVTVSGNYNYGNCTKASNGLNDSNCGAGIYNFNGSSPILRNSIVWGNRYDQIFNSLQDGGIPASTTHIAYSIVQGSDGSGANWVASAGTDEGNNLDVNPSFTTSVPFPDSSKTGDVHLKAGSPAANNGNNSYIPDGVTTDRDGNARTVGSTVDKVVDMGAYEYQDIATLPPQTSIDTHPNSPTNSNDPSFSFSSDQTGSTFQCRLDAGAWGTCTGSKAYTDLADGSHTFQVQATNGSYQDWTPASFTWAIDTTAETAIDNSSKPANPSKSASVSFSFSCSETGCTFECKLGTADWGACTSPQTYAGLAEGEHTFQVRATDALSNLDASPDSYTWTVDTLPPDTTINSHPDDPAASQSATFNFSSSESGSAFQCRLDSGAWETCTSPKAYNNLVNGAHTFQVQATDKASNPDPSPASFDWVVKVPPETTLQSKPASSSNNSSASFTFTSNEAGSTFQCTLDAGAAAACTSPQNYNNLTDGIHTFQVQATDPAGNADPSPASYSWTIDTTSPNVTLDSHPENPSSSNRAAFTFSSSEAGASFECKLNDFAWSTCTSPLSYYPLSDGEYTFQVRAKDAAGNTSTSPASYAWKIDQAPIVALPNGVLSAGYAHACAIKPDGNVDCWGDNSTGQSADQAGPYTQVSAGYFHTCALTPGGAVDCWGIHDGGSNDYGQAASQPGPYTQVSAGYLHTCALTPAGAVDCWGIHDGSSNDFGQAASQPGPYIQISAGSFNTCALKADGAVDCWGNIHTGQAGPYVQISSGTEHACGLKADGAMDCWGSNNYNQTVNQPGPFLQVSSGYVHTCALTWTGAVTCWGSDNFGQAANQAGPYIQISSGIYLSCGLTQNGAVDCWGKDAAGQPGPYSLSETSLNAHQIDNTGATFEFSSSEPKDTFECRLNGSAWEPCTSPRDYSGLETGRTTFQVRSVNAAGLPDPTPASFTWTVTLTRFWDYLPLITK